MALKNYYDILGIQPTASMEEIKQAYRKLSVKFHPDKNDGDPFLAEMFKSINQANEILSSPEKRKAYDQQLKDAKSVRNQTNFTEPFPNNQLTPKEEDEVYNLWDQYLEKKKWADSAYRNLMYARSLDKPQYITAKKVLSSVLALLLVWLFLKPTASLETANNTSNQWTIEQRTIVYKKPNKKSVQIGELAKGSNITIISETNYFYKILFRDNAGNTGEGYILKVAIQKRN